MNFRWLAPISILASLLPAQPIRFERHEIVDLGKERIVGSALEDNLLMTWGTRILSWSVPNGEMRVVSAKPPGNPGAGGCLLDIDGDGLPDLILNETTKTRALVWFDAHEWKRHEIDRGVDAHEIVPATIHGRRGVLLVQRRIQVRFYEIPADLGARWPARDIYSFYSPSDQGGLLLTDVDRDGRTDIISGNYWIQSPEEFELSWRLFAIRTWSEEKLSGMVKMAWHDLLGTGMSNLVAVQCEMQNARLAWFEKPADPKQVWTEHRLENALRLTEPHSLQVADFDGDGQPDILVIERAGAGRLIVFRNEGQGKFVPIEIGRRSGVIDARVINKNGQARPDILTVERSSIALWEKQ